MDIESAWKWIVIAFWTVVIAALGAGCAVGWWIAARNR